MRSKAVSEDMGAKDYGTPKCELFENIPLDIQNIATNIIYNYYVSKFLPLTLIQVGSCSQCLPNMISSCSFEVPQVPKLFRKVFPITPQFYPIWFAQSSIPMYKLKRWNIGVHICFYFTIRAQRGAFMRGMPNVLKELLMGNQYGSFLKTEKFVNTSMI
jgi:hypothetical protein